MKRRTFLTSTLALLSASLIPFKKKAKAEEARVAAPKPEEPRWLQMKCMYSGADGCTPTVRLMGKTQHGEWREIDSVQAAVSGPHCVHITSASGKHKIAVYRA